MSKRYGRVLAIAVILIGALAGTVTAATGTWQTPAQAATYVAKVTLPAVHCPIGTNCIANPTAYEQIHVRVLSATARGTGTAQKTSAGVAFQTFEVRVCGITVEGPTSVKVTLHMLWHTMPGTAGPEAQAKVNADVQRLRSMIVNITDPTYINARAQLAADQAVLARALSVDAGPWGNQWGNPGSAPIATRGCQ